jgi:hypothetical protein
VQPKRMERVPSDVLMLLLSHCGVNDALCLRRVCKKWHSIVARCSAFWRMVAAQHGLKAEVTPDAVLLALEKQSRERRKEWKRVCAAEARCILRKQKNREEHIVALQKEVTAFKREYDQLQRDVAHEESQIEQSKLAARRVRARGNKKGGSLNM